MVSLELWRDAIEKILQYYADLPRRYGNVRTFVIVSRDRNHFLLVHEGWDGPRRIHGLVVHAEIKDEKIWIHYDGIETSVTTELIEAGIPESDIVLAFHPPDVRERSEYAIATVPM